jgi:hypothetical protein
MLTAAALLSSATTVAAKTYCFQFGGPYCDGGRVSTGVDGGALSGAVRAWVHTSNNCASGTSQGYGLLARTPGIGKVSLMSDDIYAKNYGDFKHRHKLGPAEEDQEWPAMVVVGRHGWNDLLRGQ